MLKYSKVINNETKEVMVGFGTNVKFFENEGLTLQEVEEAYNGSWYLKGYAPEKPQTEFEKETRAKRDKYLQNTDIYMISDYPITDELRVEYKRYRAYLRDIPQNLDFSKVPVLSFNEWKLNQEA